jgi:hypothetical protein
MRMRDARVWTATAMLTMALCGCGESSAAERAAETSTTSPGDTALFPGAEEPGPQFDND